MFQTEKRVLGLDLGTANVKLAHLGFGRKGLELLGVSTVPVPEGAVTETGVADPETVSGVIREALSEAGVGRRTRQAVAGVPGKHLTVRVLTVPTMDHSELGEAVRWETAQFLPYPVDEAAFSYVELGPGTSAGTLEVLSISTRKTVVEGLVRAIELAGLEPVGVDAVPLALGRVFVSDPAERGTSLGDLQAAVTREEARGEAVAIADIGAASTDVSIFHQGRLRVSRSIPLGGARFTSAIAAALGLQAGEAERLKVREADLGVPDEESDSRAAALARALRPVAEELSDEIQRSLDYFRAQSHWLPVNGLLLAGGGGRLKGLGRFLEEHLGLAVGRGEVPPGALSLLTRTIAADRVPAVCLGLALWEVNQA